METKRRKGSRMTIPAPEPILHKIARSIGSDQFPNVISLAGSECCACISGRANCTQ
jgi:CO/xanthine dehydrogenase FAD-binding subunit